MKKEIPVSRIREDGTAEKITAAEINVTVTTNCKNCPARGKCKER